MIITIVISVYPMSLSPVWNGKIPGHRDQYERMAQSILNGHLYLEYEDVDPRLSEMENPYDPQARKELGIYYHWDHAFYNGKYYMYFGIVPVVLLFLPYQLLTGNALTTYKATQIFTVGTILAIFALFDFLRKKFFHKMPFDPIFDLINGTIICKCMVCNRGTSIILHSDHVSCLYGNNKLEPDG